MKRGPKPESAEIKERKGNPGHRPITDESKASGAGTPLAINAPSAADKAPPAWLSTADIDTPEAREVSDMACSVWEKLYPDLSRSNLLKATDENAFARYCRYMAEWIIHTRTIDREGTHYTTSSQHVGELKRPHPAMKFRKEAEQALKELGSEFGLTPGTRHRLYMQLSQLQPPAPPPRGKQEDGEQGDEDQPDFGPGFLARSSVLQ